MKKVSLPGLVMDLPTLAQGSYPPWKLGTLEKTLRVLGKSPEADIVGLGKDPQGAILVPDYCLVRFVDSNVQPGTTSQYQVQLRVANPNHGKKALVAVPALAEVRELTGTWGPNKPINVTVPSDR